MTAHIWLFAAVLLCHSGLTNAQCYWRVQYQTKAVEDVPKKEGSQLLHCKETCRADPTCKAFDFQRLRGKGCYYFKEIPILDIDGITDHYDWICDDDPCGVTPCRNGGTCVARDKRFTCICELGYAGNYCERKLWCRWEFRRESAVIGGTWSPTIFSLEECLTACRLYRNCKGIDWHYTEPVSCWFHTYPFPIVPYKDTNHYTLVCENLLTSIQWLWSWLASGNLHAHRRRQKNSDPIGWSTVDF